MVSATKEGEKGVDGGEGLIGGSEGRLGREVMIVERVGGTEGSANGVRR